MAKPVPCDVCAQCYKWSQLLHNHYLQNVGQEREGVGRESLTTAILANLLFPYTLPLFDQISEEIPHFRIGGTQRTELRLQELYAVKICPIKVDRQWTKYCLGGRHRKPLLLPPIYWVRVSREVWFRVVFMAGFFFFFFLVMVVVVNVF